MHIWEINTFIIIHTIEFDSLTISTRIPYGYAI